jgi:hypothetical protein
LCIDPTSPLRGERISNLLSPIGIRVLIGVRDTATPKRYGDIHEWLTNKFINVTTRTVEGFDPARAAGAAQQDWRAAQGAGDSRRVFLWGRPGFIGVAKNGRSMPMYFAFADMPTGPGHAWTFNYYTGSENGIARFSPNERDAQPLDLDSSRGGVQAEEVHDIQPDVGRLVEPLEKWVMLYGGGLTRLPRGAQAVRGTELFAAPSART